jgi:hypothetical protein
MGFNSVQLGMREAWDLTMYNRMREAGDLTVPTGYVRGMGFDSVQLGMRETWDLTVYTWI